MYEVAGYKCHLDDQNNKGGLGKLYSMHGRDEKCLQWFSKKPVAERHDNELMSSIQGGELLEHINDIACDGLPTLKLFIYLRAYLFICSFVCLFIYVDCRVNMLSDGSSLLLCRQS